MCGICGVVNYRNREFPSTYLAEKMLDSLAHRGPDSSGYYRDRNALLGHTRLAVIDLKTGLIPLFFLAILIIFTILYIIKSLLGIDIFPGGHFWYFL